MRRTLLLLPLVVLGALAQPPARPEPHRSPCDLVLVSPTLALTANHTSDSVSLVDLAAGKLLAEVAVGRKPEAIALAPDGKSAVVSNLWSHSLTQLKVGTATLEAVATFPIGASRAGLVFTPDGRHLWVALSGDDAVVLVDLDQRKIVKRLPAEREPRQVALSRDGRWLAAASSKSAQARCWDLRDGTLVWERTAFDAFNLRGLLFAPDEKSLISCHVIRRDFPVTKENIEAGWVIDSRMTRFALEKDVTPSYWQIALDRRGEAVGDPHGLAFNPSGTLLALTASGSQELLLLQNEHIPWTPGEPGDFIDFSLEDGTRLRRIPLGGRPMGVKFAGDDRLVVANYLLDAVQVIDAKAGTIERTIPLGGPRTPGLARKGEALFHDAKRSHNQWFSCHTCHVDGHTCGLTFDTLNDHTYGTPKLTSSLRNVTKTGPWTWLGWQKDLAAAVKKSYTETLFGPEPSKEEVEAVLAYLETLQTPPHPRGPELAAEARRGKVIFEGKAHCIRCHRGDYLTSPATYDVKIGYDTDLQKYFNPPSLLGLRDHGPFLHDARAKSLQELLERHHTSEMVGGEKLTDAERRDLLEYLKSL